MLTKMWPCYFLPVFLEKMLCLDQRELSWEFRPELELFQLERPEK